MNLYVTVLVAFALSSSVAVAGYEDLWSGQVLGRLKRQSLSCNAYQFKCKDGSCIEEYLQCNGVSDCNDGSDENLEACSNNYCPPFAFRCSYGACIAGKKECDGVSNCADNSDEVTLNCPGVKETYSRSGNCSDNRYQCNNLECIHEDQVCNGNRDCSDNSDETSEVCATHYCPAYAFRCAYGACVQGKSRCNRLIDCWDGSDEAEALCGRPPPPTTTARPAHSNSCSVPHIENGRVRAKHSNQVLATGSALQNGQSVGFECVSGTRLGPDSTYCIEGSLLENPPRCITGCPTLPLDSLSVKATCADRDLTHIPCTEVVPETTFAFLQCKTGYKRPKDFVESIYCRADGTWSDHVDRCLPVCGRITFGVPFISGGQVADIAQVPWHVAVYELQTKDTFQQICGGTIISATAVISAAHCFWDADRDEKKDPALFRVMAGKSLRDYNAQEKRAQSMGVKHIDVPETYQGITALYGSDIAVLKLVKSIIYQTYIAPICLRYLQQGAQVVSTGTKGRVAGWGTTEGESPSPVLKVIDLDAVDYTTCTKMSEPTFKSFVLVDKFCATRVNENVCQGDSGGGFTEKKETEDGDRFYLRGLVSVGSNSWGKVECRTNRTYTTFTNIMFYNTLYYKYTQE